MKYMLSDMPKKANLGCGYDVQEGYLNVDLHERHGPDLVADVSELPMLPSDWFEEIVAQDVLEHLPRQKVTQALQEWSRILAPNGVIRIRVPSLELLTRLLAHPSNRPAEKAEEIIHLMYGTQNYTGDFHLSGFTAPLIEAYLDRVGLKVCRAEFVHGWCFDVYGRKTQYLADDAEFVHSVYFNLMGRGADPGGLNHFVTALRAGMPRQQVVAELAASDEARVLREMPSYLLGHVTADRALVNDGTRVITQPEPAEPTVRSALRQLMQALRR